MRTNTRWSSGKGSCVWGQERRTAGRRRRHGATRSGRHARLAWRGEDAVPKNARASKTGVVLHRLVRRRVQITTYRYPTRKVTLRFSRREIEPRRELDTRFSVRVREWKAVLSLVSREHRVETTRTGEGGSVLPVDKSNAAGTGRDEDVEANGGVRNLRLKEEMFCCLRKRARTGRFVRVKGETGREGLFCIDTCNMA